MTNNLIYKLYSNTVELEFDTEKHWYFANGDYVPSVTGIVDYLDKSGPLMGWAVNMVIGYFKQNLKPGKVLDEVELVSMFDEAKRAHRVSVATAATTGTLIHNWIEEYIKARMAGEKKDPKIPLNARVKNGVDAFLSWEKENEPEYIESESKIYSKKYKYAGTCDLVARLKGKLAVIDFKTGKGPYYGQVIQTAAYQHALAEEKGYKFNQRWILKVDKNTGKFEAHQAKLFNQDFKSFLALLTIYERHRLGVLTKKKEKTYYGN